jgi:hypothetical protein
MGGGYPDALSQYPIFALKSTLVNIYNTFIGLRRHLSADVLPAYDYLND